MYLINVDLEWGIMMKKQDRNIVIFLFITFLLPLLSISIQSIIDNSSIHFILYGIEAASPTIAVIAVLTVNRNVNKFFQEMFHTKRLAMALFLPIVVAGSTMFLAKLIFSFLFHINFAFGKISFMQLIVILWALVAEELGWRGYLEPCLKERVRFKRMVPFLVGIIWCLWHYHYFLIDGMQVPILLFLISCVVESYLYSYLMKCTNNNLVSAMTYHFAWNLFVHIFAVAPIDNNGNAFPYMILILLEALMLMIFYLTGKKRLPAF